MPTILYFPVHCPLYALAKTDLASCFEPTSLLRVSKVRFIRGLPIGRHRSSDPDDEGVVEVEPMRHVSVRVELANKTARVSYMLVDVYYSRPVGARELDGSGCPREVRVVQVVHEAPGHRKQNDVNKKSQYSNNTKLLKIECFEQLF